MMKLDTDKSPKDWEEISVSGYNRNTETDLKKKKSENEKPIRRKIRKRPGTSNRFKNIQLRPETDNQLKEETL